MMIDAHIHFDHYKADERKKILDDLHNNGVEALVSVSINLDSCKKNFELSLKDSRIKPAFGFHPEQEIPSDEAMEKLFSWMQVHVNDMVAVGEVGLPYYKKIESKAHLNYKPYIQLLERFIVFAAKWNKPIVLHAVYEDANIACDLLEKHSLKNAHFHWFKGDERTVIRMANNGYFISITPDLYYEEESERLVKRYPLEQMMIETDGPWSFEGPFAGTMTEPKMMKYTIEKISEIKGISYEKVEEILYENTKKFYRI